MGIMHDDLVLRNIVFKDGNFKLVDFDSCLKVKLVKGDKRDEESFMQTKSIIIFILVYLKDQNEKFLEKILFKNRDPWLSDLAIKFMKRIKIGLTLI